MIDTDEFLKTIAKLSISTEYDWIDLYFHHKSRVLLCRTDVKHYRDLNGVKILEESVKNNEVIYLGRIHPIDQDKVDMDYAKREIAPITNKMYELGFISPY